MTMAAAKGLEVREREITDEEAERSLAGEDLTEGEEANLPEERSDALPDWAPTLPEKLKIPLGVTLAVLRVRKELTITPHKGDRVLVVWPINEVEERQAVQRARGDEYALSTELAKACIRAVDGVVADRTGATAHPGNVGILWRELGPKGRHLVRTYYTRTHTLSQEETADFFMNCMVTRTAAPG
jgi:hypothetical protein